MFMKLSFMNTGTFMTNIIGTSTVATGRNPTAMATFMRPWFTATPTRRICIIFIGPAELPDERRNMTEKKPGIWFPAKKYGWGWGLPCAWQGWVVMLIYLGLVFAAIKVINPAVNRRMLCVSVIIGLSILFCLVCWWKGEKPAWRWGDKK